MARFNNPLRGVQVAAPCNASWDEMIGDARVRFCGQCSLNVYNLSAMRRDDAEALIARSEGRLCVRFYRRIDGSIIISDCPIGLQAIRRRVSYAWKAITAVVLSFLAGTGAHFAAARFAQSSEMVMGALAMPPPRRNQYQGQVILAPVSELGRQRERNSGPQLRNPER